MTESTMTSQDTRRATRRMADQPSTLRGATGPHDSWVHDVSSTGMRIECRAELAIGEEVSVGLAGAGMTRARIVWKRDAEYGCEFFEPLSTMDAERAFAGSPVVPLLPFGEHKRRPNPTPDEHEAELLALLQNQPAQGRWWIAGLLVAMLLVAGPASWLVSRLL